MKMIKVVDKYGAIHWLNTANIIELMDEPHGKDECVIIMIGGERVYMNHKADYVMMHVIGT